MKPVLSAIGLVAVLFVFPADRSGAQPPRRTYTPRPTLSPWLNLHRLDPGPFGPYLSYVRPQLRLQEMLARQRESIARQQVALQALGQQVEQVQEQGAAGPTGVGATFMNYSHYFGTFGTGGGVTGRTSGAGGISRRPSSTFGGGSRRALSGFGGLSRGSSSAIGGFSRRSSTLGYR